MFLVRTDPGNANRVSLTVSSLSVITITSAFKGIRSYIGDSARFLSN